MVILLWYNHALSHVSDDLRRTPETLEDSIEPSLRTTVLSNLSAYLMK